MTSATESSGDLGDQDVERLGTLDSGVVALLRSGSVAEFGDARVRWWVRGPRRWHDPAAEPSRRTARLEGTPVVRTSVRLPAGDIHVVVGAAVDGVGAAVVIELDNPTSDPVAVAFAVESGAPIEVSSTALRSGALTLSLGRAARASAATANVSTAFTELTESDPGDLTEGRVGPGVAALVLPVPHGTTATAVVRVGVAGPGGEATGEADVGVLSTQFGRGGSRLVAGWRRVLERGPVLDGGGDATEAWSAAMSDALLGPDGAEPTVADLGSSVVALARMGELEIADRWVIDLLNRQRVAGAVAGEDPVAATASLLEAVTALWSGGVDRSGASRLLGPTGAAIEWLASRRRRAAVEAAGSVVGGALAGVVPFLVAQGQSELAGEVAHRAGELGWTGATSAAPRLPTGRHDLVAALDGVVAETARGIEVARSWTPDRRGFASENHGVPTRWGPVSWALRWHGERPALLHEVTPWPDRPGPPPRWTARSLDPNWHVTGSRGEALLAASSSEAAAGQAVRR